MVFCGCGIKRSKLLTLLAH
uniref:Uncharacterized protein n=1 Tax=Glycine max TaxID=3847 RepID=C6T6L5_SOYBN|nr:unknown [Glycine max]